MATKRNAAKKSAKKKEDDFQLPEDRIAIDIKSGSLKDDFCNYGYELTFAALCRPLYRSALHLVDK